jgi:hypothetical protein
MRSTILLVSAILILGPFAGCLSDSDSKDVNGRAKGAAKQISGVLKPEALTKLTDLAFAEMKIIDKDHAGGEPVILVTKKGTIILSSHPGWTHLRGPDADLVTGANGQIYVWRSENGGQSWSFVGLPVVPAGPRNAAISVSDPDIAMSPDGSIFLSSLNSLVTIPVEISKDEGKTWTGQPAHGPAGVDRNWIEACNDKDIFQVYSSFAHAPLTMVPGGPFGKGGRWFAHSTDGGMTWTDQHAVGVGGNLACDQKTEGGKYLYMGGGPRLSVSTDKGKTWKTANVTGHERGSGGLSEPAIDGAGNVYTTWIENSTTAPRLFYAVSLDHGASFARTIEIPLTNVIQGAQLWPWITAKDDGRLAIVWYATSKVGNPAQFDPTVEWHVYSAIVPDAYAPEPTAYVSKASSLPIHKGPICMSGTACQANPNPSGDRRLGDFFTATFDNEGALLIATAATTPVGGTTAADGGGLAHPAFMKQTLGPSGLSATPFIGGNATST